MSEKSAQPGLVLLEIDPAEELEALRAWYREVRIPEVLVVPGVTGVSEWASSFRFREVGDGSRVPAPALPAYLVVVELDDVAVARSEPFLDAIGRDFRQTAEVDGELVAFDQLMTVTLREIRNHVNPEFATTEARGLMSVSFTPEREYTDLMHEWYDTVHVGELMSCPGYLRVRRYQALDGIPNFFALYELDSPEALNGERMKSFSGRSFEQLPALTQRVMPHLTHNLLVIYARLD